MTTEQVIFNNVSFRYAEDQPWVLKNVNFSIKQDEWVAILGHNGSGKSTIAKLMNGLLFPDEGEIYVHGIKVTPDTVWDVREKVGMVFQNPDNQFVGTTVRDDVAFGLENRGIDRNIMIKRIEESLLSVRMTDYLLHEPHRLSGGQKQRVAIAGVLAIQPNLIILDEATAMLDPRGRKEIMTTVNDLRRETKVNLVSITHDLNEITGADRVIVMNDGEVWLETVPRELFKQETALRQIGLDVPFTAKLANRLQTDFEFSQQPLTQKELLDQLWTFHSNK
ncbi:energy-coupling factor transporter ATP-binding protein EcfA1 [Halolactibacillus alkaliphilus]|uniref:Energy-coupling factor transporter ATP-binding protein EcfA1 n=1 Tax=Halolactibacillus alkaliphilus TaxID=442899 RepID=A0A511X1U2_9BACI|nr:energy-coupling factor ABC transporter ATP-binding protein [Halolactibacillus alkaliphilus]GEN56903.1 energy-coupling factor transporter ATP-binding protein EcfA1 [Halolactibacillus alkaliphilus]GGN70420.1 energy-coupling factor transporter ATP-binding protein EcfA1 [Halolactibacillus alkaliphilus]SFO83324.1 energy-coupling factor transport system ATP-binding protein [Halolactibacillus alkaliphilus]